MQLSKKQQFGLITFILLVIAAILVTVEPWKKPEEQVRDRAIEKDSLYVVTGPDQK
ncbi:MAG: hypothetical protein KAR19_15280 [Bacteroidales bacterium]|nr:hypothetical protein [Bacteroidales bacterium]